MSEKNRAQNHLMKTAKLTIILVLVLLVQIVKSETPTEQKIIQNIIKNTTVTATKVDDPSVSECFSATFYIVAIKHKTIGTESSTDHAVYAQTADILECVSPPMMMSNMDYLAKLVRPTFKLRSAAEAQVMLNAMNLIYPTPFSKPDHLRFKQDGTTWKFILGKMGPQLTGYIMTTDASGTVVSIERSIRIE